MAPKVTLEKISSQSFEHEADRAALEALKKTVGFDQLMRAISRFGADKVWHVINESSNIRLSEQQVGSIWKLHREVARTLDLDPVPPLYLQHDVRLNAYTSGVDAPFIVVTSGLVEGMTDDEIACVLGHEMGHILAGHVLYGMVARSLGLLLTLLGGGELTPMGSMIKLTLFSAIQYWSRCAELTADRAGLLAVQDPRVALSVEMKLASGCGARIARELDLDQFMAQARQFEVDEGGRLDRFWRAVLENDRSHPWPVVRAHELDRWVRTGDYPKILAGQYQRRAKSVIASGDRPEHGNGDATEGMAAVAELAIAAALARTYGVHVAPRIPEPQLHLVLGSYAETLEPTERVVALYDRTLSGHGDKGVLLTDRRVFASSRPRAGVFYRDVRSLKLAEGGFLSDAGISVEGLDLHFHTRSIRDAFAAALTEAARAFRGEPPEQA
jgi:Zn-dependent protease with chaperone function